ncbi:MAG: hypothetical protein IPH05_07225 [Flavobacteriales bacterium]|jgi:hypothetical protein|nr:hypothetical protein [Flavobacteriales bacterium]MBK6882719.1 hypothetical protein [Flavobacteriales bacterium]MBK7103454.1 hypothetical protein [Flavobacteriales bacterium]MBK7114052.1 hypothetical protein [Flavobacteriales bacterium]MBK7483883.1 hypothetical protein [Flavobacteriales bacterium]
MKKDRIRKLAEERIALGYSRQHIQDELVLMHPEAKPKRIAEVLRYLAPEATRSQFRSYQQALLALVVLTGAMELAAAVVQGSGEGIRTWRWIRVVPFAALFLGYALYKWRGESLQWLAILNGFAALGLIGSIRELFAGEAEPWTLASGLMSLAICILASYLAAKAFPKYEVLKDPVGGAPPRYLFPPENGMRMM